MNRDRRTERYDLAIRNRRKSTKTNRGDRRMMTIAAVVGLLAAIMRLITDAVTPITTLWKRTFHPNGNGR